MRKDGDAVLMRKAEAVTEFGDELEQLVENMFETMYAAPGVGLAAPQVGIVRRVLVYQTAEDKPVVALVNPRLVSSSDERESAEEGCLSLGASSVVVPVERPHRISVEAVSPGGEPIRIDAEELEARVIQHELDHLDGVLTIDRTTPDARRQALGELRPQPVLG